MRKFIFIIFSFIISLSTSNAEVINKILIDGNKRVSNETIKIYGEIEVGKDYNEADLNKILKNLYSTNFFEDIDLKLNNNILEIKIKEYPIINQLILIGEDNKSLKKQIIKTLQVKEKRAFIKSFLSKDIERIKDLYSTLGYNFSEVVAKIKNIDNENVDVIITIKRGEKTKISSIKFIGNNNVRSNRLKDIIASEEDKFWKIITRNTNLSENLISLDIRLLRNYYKSIGFYDIKVRSNFAQLDEKGKAELVYTLEEGNRYIINKISTNVDSVFDKKLFFPLNNQYEKYIGTYYSPFTITKLLENLDELIEQNNLQFVEHNVQEIVSGNEINVIFNVFEGEKTLVERINILGNNITNEDVIRGELILDEGDPFTKLNLDKSVSELKSRNLFKTVNYEINDGSEPNLKIINFIVEEKPTGEISAGAGFGTNGGTVAFTVKENNWLGEGKSLALDVEIDQESLAGSLNFNDPNYDFLGNSINYSLASEKNDKPDKGYENSIISAGVGTSFEQYKDVVASLGLEFTYDDLKTENSASDSLKKQAGTFDELAFSYGFSQDKRNRSFKPTSGFITSFRQTLPIYADKSFIENTFVASRYKTLSENIVGSGKLYLSAINGVDDEDVRISKRKSLSSKRMRGFERNKIGPVDSSDHIGGNYAASLNFETNLPNLLPDSTNMDVSLFLDFGNVWGVDYDDSIDESNKIRSSVGIFTNWMSPIGPMVFTLSQNLSKADTDVTESFNFNLGTTF